MGKVAEVLLEAEKNGSRVSVAVNGDVVAVYSRHNSGLEGEVIDVEKEYGFRGFLGLSRDFFHMFRMPSHRGSDMRNAAKGFFQREGENYACLVQYLRPEGQSREHYHTLGERIACIAGRSFLVMRPVEHDTEKQIVELTPGTVYDIPPNTLHTVETNCIPSITVPVKRTIPGMSDHLRLERSDERLASEAGELLRYHFNSGTEAAAALAEYYKSLRRSEKPRLAKLIKSMAAETTNPNRAEILHDALSYF